MGQLTKNFHRKEFDCKDGTKVPNEYRDNLIKLAKNLQVLRDYLGKEIIINSGYRSTSHNAKVSKAKNSQHLLATAADVRVSGLTSKELYNAILKLIQNGKMHNGGLGLYNTFVHYDVRNKPARW